ncbi:hypothetical protein B4589_009770 [Halolamina sp. CBA1230]|uniref:hypothetical protein n=1 Tax=Halolamina sp. CBA1230 TaxID=1853690 RepID=UPI00117B323F|nr:hypothetical protein [Halolamina sp. CBA1230]QKY20652.1 hypothetical protein B4589_009770 [Halolamina sp. CBA1230]
MTVSTLVRRFLMAYAAVTTVALHAGVGAHYWYLSTTCTPENCLGVAIAGSILRAVVVGLALATVAVMAADSMLRRHYSSAKA